MDVIIDGMAWLPKSEIRDVDLFLLKRRLTIIPKATSEFKAPTPIELFIEKEKHIGVPRAYYFENMNGNNNEIPSYSLGNELGNLEEIKLRDYQKIPIDSVSNRLINGKLGESFVAETGVGKCLGGNVDVLMYDGSVKNVKDVFPSDKLMGPDSQPRIVKSITKGFGPMYRVIPVKGMSWECNDAHILSLRCNYNKKNSVVDYKKGEIQNICIEDYLNKNKEWKHIHKQWRTGIDFQYQHTNIPSYIMGAWLGDGSWHHPVITKRDEEIRKEFYSFAKEYGLKIREEHKCNTILHHFSCDTAKKNILREEIKRAKQNKEKRIPKEYLLNNKEKRLELLAGLLDTDGYSYKGNFEIITKYEGLKNDILYLCRSLGFAAYSSIKTARIKSIGFKGEYYRIYISGDLCDVPIKIKRKIPSKRKMNKNVTNVGFKIEKIPDNFYYGFEIEGNDRLFILSDFTVTHNTIMALELSRRLNRTTLIIVHKTTLAKQWELRILGDPNSDNEFNRRGCFPGVKVGFIGDGRCEYKDCQFVIGLVQTLCEKELPEDFYENFGFVISDEMHRLGADKWSKAIPKLKAKWRFAVSATPERKDKAEKAFLYHIGGIVENINGVALKPKVFVKETGFYFIQTPSFDPSEISKEQYISAIIDSKKRNELIVREIVKAATNNRKIVVVSHRVEHLELLMEWTKYLMNKVGINFSMGDFFKGDKKATSKKAKEELSAYMEEMKTKDIIFMTYKMGEEGEDLVNSDCLFMTTPLSDPRQIVGRILRSKEGKKIPLVVDFVESKVEKSCSMLRSRKNVYIAKDWEVKEV